MENGKLYLIPTTLGGIDEIDKVLPSYNIRIIHQLDEFIVEQLRTARRFISKVKHPKPIDALVFHDLNKHTDEQQVYGYLDAVLKGKSIGLLSEAGTPCVADPGAVIVQMAHERNIDVIPLTGPNSIILSLMASGFNGQQFAFHGYLPVDARSLTQKIRDIESVSRKLKQTQIFIETPYRNNQLLSKLVSVCKPDTKICVATNLTFKDEFIKTKEVRQWKKETVDLHKKPTVFLLYF
jgi:16S rRNA (cytidine1402-2'-O)-methyltransferase